MLQNRCPGLRRGRKTGRRFCGGGGSQKDTEHQCHERLPSLGCGSACRPRRLILPREALDSLASEVEAILLWLEQHKTVDFIMVICF